jgi:voltage-gated potassium channel
MKLKLIVHNHLFKILNKEGQIMVANTLEHISFSPGEFIIKRKDMGNEMFFIAHGTVEVLREDKVVLAQLLDGQFFGEIALLRDTERTADVVAKSYCDLYKLERQHLLPIMEAYPHLVEHLNEVINRRVGDRRGPNNNNSNNNSNNNGSDSPTKPADLKKAA